MINLYNYINGQSDATRVTTLAALRAAVLGTSPKIVKISGIITGGA